MAQRSKVYRQAAEKIDADAAAAKALVDSQREGLR